MVQGFIHELWMPNQGNEAHSRTEHTVSGLFHCMSPSPVRMIRQETDSMFSFCTEHWTCRVKDQYLDVHAPSVQNWDFTTQTVPRIVTFYSLPCESLITEGLPTVDCLSSNKTKKSIVNCVLGKKKCYNE